MAWRDRVRRRGTVPDAARSDGAGAGAAGAGAAGTVQEAAAGRGPGVPADWDGGWRRTAPPLLTVSRAPMGVSDGLAFRDGLAAWRDPSFDTGLAHALLPTAPTGLVRGIARPATAHPTHSGGGPLLLRALRPSDADAAPGAGAGAPRPEAPPAPEVPPAPGAQATGRPRPGGSGARVSGARASAKGAPVSAQAAPAVRAGTGRSRADEAGEAGGRPGRSGGGREAPSEAGAAAGAPGTRGRPPAQSAAVLGPDALGANAAPVVQRAEAAAAAPSAAPAKAGRTSAPARLPLVRRIAVVPGASGVGAPGAAPVGRPVQRTATGAGSLPAATGTRPGHPGEGAPADRAEATHAVVRTRPVGRSLTVARVPATPRRRVPAVRPAVPPAHTGGPSPDAPVQRAADHAPPLGTPPTEVPAPAAPSDVVGPAPAPAPAMPVVQRQAETVPARPGTPVRGADAAPVQRAADRPALGTSAAELPPPARTLAPEAATPAPAAPTLQRQAETAADAPVQRAADHPTLGAPATELPSTKEPLGPDPAPPTPAMPIVQRPTESPSDTPVQRAAGRPTLGPPLAELPATAAPLGTDAAVRARAGEPPPRPRPRPRPRGRPCRSCRSYSGSRRLRPPRAAPRGPRGVRAPGWGPRCPRCHRPPTTPRPRPPSNECPYPCPCR